MQYLFRKFRWSRQQVSSQAYGMRTQLLFEVCPRCVARSKPVGMSVGSRGMAVRMHYPLPCAWLWRWRSQKSSMGMRWMFTCPAWWLESDSSSQCKSLQKSPRSMHQDFRKHRSHETCWRGDHDCPRRLRISVFDWVANITLESSHVIACEWSDPTMQQAGAVFANCAEAGRENATEGQS